MKAGEHERLAALEQKYWWHVGRRDILRRVLDAALPPSSRSRTVVDIGCGAGGNIELLADYGAVVAMDDSTVALSLVRSAGHHRTLCGSADALPIRTDSVDVIAMLDVLEHIDRDADVLRECCRALKPGGVLLLSVPAYQWLWSGHDEALGHRRRYVETALLKMIEQAGLEIRLRSYAVCLLFPLIAGFRVVERLLSKRQQTSYVMVPAAVNSSFVALLRLEALLIGRGAHLPFGTSIVVTAVKPASRS